MKTILIDDDAEYSYWRLPTIQELQTLVNFSKFNPVCNLKDILSDYYWSIIPYVSGSNYAWHVTFKNGYDNWDIKSGSNLVRCVRDGEKV